MVNDADRPSWAVAHDEDRVRATLAANRLEIVKLYPGRWASDGIQVQDLVIAGRRGIRATRCPARQGPAASPSPLCF